MAHPIFQKADLTKLSPSIICDVEAFAEENNQPPAETVYDVLHYYLMWNGIIGYTSVIAEILQSNEDAEGEAP